MTEKPHATQRLWSHAVRRAGSALEAGAPLPPLPKLKMRGLTWSLLHFAELLEGLVPAADWPSWQAETSAARATLAMVPGPRGSRTLGPVDATASWANLGRAVNQAATRSVHAPSLAGVAQRATVGVAFTLFRRSAQSRAEANENIRRGLDRLEAGCWISAARERAGAQLQDARGWWGGGELALFEDRTGAWWLVRMPTGHPVTLEPGSREDLLASVPDDHFTRAVRTVLGEQR